MVQDAPRKGSLVTFGADPRITPVGRFLRATKIDELPQLINVLLGDMSLVGPRPEVRKYVEMFRDDYAEILRVRPGITDPASIKYRNEAEILGRAEDPEKEYIERILPEKIRLAKEYVRNSSLWLDFMIILKTIRVVGRRGMSEQGMQMTKRMNEPYTHRHLQVPFFRPSIGEAEIEEVAACLRSGWLTTGPADQAVRGRLCRGRGGQACPGGEFLHRGPAPGRRGPGA